MTTVYICLSTPELHARPGSEPGLPEILLECELAADALCGANTWLMKPGELDVVRVHERLSDGGWRALSGDTFPFHAGFYDERDSALTDAAYVELSSRLGRVVPPGAAFPFLAVRELGGQQRVYHLLEGGARGNLYVSYGSGEVTLAPLELIARCRPAWEVARKSFNNRCWYSKYRSDVEIERKLTFATPVDTWHLNYRLFEALLANRFPGFILEFNDEFQVWDFENYMFDVLSPPEQRGYISFIPQSNGLMTVKQKLFAFDQEVRVERLSANVELDVASCEQRAREMCGGEVRALPHYRRKRFDVNLESLETGNVYGIFFDLCRPLGQSEDALIQCEIEYLRSRTMGEHTQVLEEYRAVVALAEGFLRDAGVSFTPGYYSKLSYLRDYVARYPVRSSNGVSELAPPALPETLEVPPGPRPWDRTAGARCFVAFGSWKLRHNEPMERDETLLRLIPLRELPRLGRTACTVRLEQAAFEREGWVVDGPLSEEWSGLIPSMAEEVPLALVVERGGALEVTHLLMRAAEPVLQFFRVDLPAVKEAELWRAINDAYEAQHLWLSNHECYYLKDQQDIELEQKLSLSTPFSYLELCLRLRRSLARGEAPGFQLQLGDEFQFWSYDNYFFEIQPNEQRDAGYVSVISYCKRKKRWADPMFMFKKKIYSVDSLERWEKNFENQWVDGDKSAALSAYFGYPISELPTWRRTRCDVAFESDDGNVFMVNFDDCRVWHDPSPRARLQQVEVEYLRTRGKPDRSRIYADFQRLVAFVESKAREWGFTPQLTHYSKLTFLRDYVAPKNQPVAGAQPSP